MLQMLRLRRRPVLVRSQPQRVLLLLLLLLRCKSLQRVPLRRLWLRLRRLPPPPRCNRRW